MLVIVLIVSRSVVGAGPRLKFCGLGGHSSRELRRQHSIQPVNDVGAPVNARSLSLNNVEFEPRRRRVNESEAINLQGRTLVIEPPIAPPPSPDDAVSEPRRRRVNEREAINLQGRTLVIEPPIAPPPSPAHDFHMDQLTPDDTNVNSSPVSTVNESTPEQIQADEENTAAHDKQAKFLHEQISNYPSEYKNEIVEEPPQPYSSDDENSRPSIEINVDGSISTSDEETIEKSPSSVLYSPKHIFKDKKPKTINDNRKEGHQNKDKSKRTIRKDVKIAKMSKIASAKTEPVTFPNRARIHPKVSPSEEDLLKQILGKNTKTRRDNEPIIIRYNSC